MIEEKIITLEELQKQYYVNLGFWDSQSDKELFLLCEIINYRVGVTEVNQYASVLLEINPIDPKWEIKYLDLFGADEEYMLIKRNGLKEVSLEYSKIIKKQNND
jgi:hypothetical protein